MFYGVDVDYRDYTVSLMDEKKKVVGLSHFWKEGFYWFVDHHKPDIITVNFPLEENSSKLKAAADLVQKLKKNFEYVVADKELLKEKPEKIIVKTSADLFFKKIVRKELLPIHTREGIEQRIYNLRKTGIYLDKRMLSQKRNKLIRELNAVICAFTSYSVENNSYEIVEEDGQQLIIPKYRFVPSSNRIKRRVPQGNQENAKTQAKNKD